MLGIQNAIYLIAIWAVKIRTRRFIRAQRVAQAMDLTKIGCDESANPFNRPLHPSPSGTRSLTAPSLTAMPVYHRAYGTAQSLVLRIWCAVALIGSLVFVPMSPAAQANNALLSKAVCQMADADAEASLDRSASTRMMRCSDAASPARLPAGLVRAVAGVVSALPTPASVL